MSELSQLDTQNNHKGYKYLNQNAYMDQNPLFKFNDENLEKKLLDVLAMDDELQKKLEQKKRQIREAAVSQGIRQVDLNKFKLEDGFSVSKQKSD